MRMMLTAALKPDAQSTGRSESPPMPGDRFHIVFIAEEEWTGDGRFFRAGSIAWAELPMPMMAQDWTDEMHLNALMVGTVDTVERLGNEVHGWGSYLQTDDEDVLRLQTLMRTGRLRWVSADMDDPEFEVIIPAEALDEPEEDDDGNLRMTGTFPLTEYSHVRIRGATALPFQAVDSAKVVDDEGIWDVEDPEVREQIAAAGAKAGIGWVDCDCQEPVNPLAEWCPNVDVPPFEPSVIVAAAATARAPGEAVAIEPPVLPPLEWFANPLLSGPTATTITDEGRIYGHLAAWGSCHIGFDDRCVTPPRSAASYAYFLTGELITADGPRVNVGKLTIGAGHAPIHLTSGPAVAHYDNATWAFADVNVGEDDHGIWIAGALRPDLSAASLRAIMAAELSGDWRKIGRGLELVAALAVNVPGFARPRVAVAQRDGIIASLVASLPVIERTRDGRRKMTERLARSAVERIAGSVGRSTQDRIAEQVARVRGER